MYMFYCSITYIPVCVYRPKGILIYVQGILNPHHLLSCDTKRLKAVGLVYKLHLGL